MNFYGIIIGLSAILIIGIWHPIVIKGEYYLGKKKCAVIFAIVALLSLGASLFINNNIATVLLGTWGGAALWGIKEAYDQEVRVNRGQYPRNPKRQAK